MSNPHQLRVPGTILYNLATLFIKSSILAFYLRFSIERAFRLTVYAVLFVAVGYCLASALGPLYLCTPLYRFTSIKSVEGTCVNIGRWYLALAAFNVATDFMILALPFWILRPLRVNLSQRIALLVVLMAGGL